MCIGLWPAAPRNLKKWPMANFELETPGVDESMILFKGRTSLKQYNSMKLIGREYTGCITKIFTPPRAQSKRTRKKTKILL